MQLKFLLPLVLSFTLSFLINFLTHQNLLISLINASTLTLSIYLFRSFIKGGSLFKFLLITSFGLIPLFGYSPNAEFISLLPLIPLLFFITYKHFPKRWILVVFALLLLIANLYSGKIVKYPFNIEASQLIFNSPEVNYNISRHQKDALFIPFKMRQIFYSKSIYIYAGLTNFFDFLNLKNLSDILLIANLYPLFIGTYKLLAQRTELRNVCLTAFLITTLTVSMDRSPDKFQSLYLLGPIFILIIILGTQAINKKAYSTLWLLSLYILISPKI